MKKRESWLELGLLTLVVATVGAAGIALAGRLAESARHRRLHRHPPPDAGVVAPHAHRNIAGPAAR